MARADEYRFRVTPETAEKFNAMAAAHGISWTAMFAVLVNTYGSAKTPLELRQNSANDGSAKTPLELRQNSANDGQIAESVGDYRGLVKDPNQEGEGETKLTNTHQEGVSGEPKKPDKTKKPEEDHPGFEDFSAAFPARCPRIDWVTAKKAWNKHKPDVAVVVEALAWQDAEWPDWQRKDERGKYIIEAPAVWINQHRWGRARPAAPKEPPSGKPARI